MAQESAPQAPEGLRPGRGRLKVYLGAAPGVGKTFRMLEEDLRRSARGTDVVVGLVECHGRHRTEAMPGSLEVVPRARRTYRDAELTELDLDGVLAHGPRVVLIDELAHSNVPGGRHTRRWQDVENLLDALFQSVFSKDAPGPGRPRIREVRSTPCSCSVRRYRSP